MSHLKHLAAYLLLGLLAACAGSVAPPGPPHPEATHAYDHPETTALGKVFEPEASRHPGLSGFDLITSGRTAFEARYAFSRLAQKTIDAQYFIWAGDAVGSNLLLALLDAADRGVRVRLLIDDLNEEGDDLGLAALNTHPNVEVRLFNPFNARSTHFLDYVTDFARVNHRMHDKAFIVDNTIAVVGGRNIADQYFSVNDQSNFRDLDLFAAGDIVRRVSAEFDEFWNSPWAVSVNSLAAPHTGDGALRELRQRLSERAKAKDFPFRTELDQPFLERLVVTVPKRLIWGRATLLFDRPDKPETGEPDVAQALHVAAGETLRRELLLESAYFIPAERGTRRLCELEGQGVKIRVLTNSLASTDETAAFAGYERYRKDLLKCGVELHELRPDAAFVRREWPWLRHRSEAELHTKAAVFDRDKVMVGSFNIDPRSRYLNTEMAILVDSPQLADKVATFIESGMSLVNSFLLQLDADGHLVWLARTNGQELRFDSEPIATAKRRFEADFLELLPIEELL